MNSLARIAIKCYQNANSSAANQTRGKGPQANQNAGKGHKRQMYILLSQLCLDLYFLLPTTQVRYLLPVTHYTGKISTSCLPSTRVTSLLPVVNLKSNSIVQVSD